MKKFYRSRSFTLIELLVVVAVIGVLAGLLLSVATNARQKQEIAVARVECVQLQTAIEQYKAAFGFYPPDNTAFPCASSLYYELVGTTRDGSGTIFTPLDGGPAAFQTVLRLTYGVDSVFNSAPTNTDSPARSFLRNLRPNQIGAVTNVVHPSRFLVCSISVRPGRNFTQGQPIPPWFNPWFYVSTNPTNNPDSFDLWANLWFGDEKKSINNWSR